MNTRIERMLLENFPDEIDHTLVPRAGAPEVATDAGDVMVTDIVRRAQTARGVDQGHHASRAHGV